MIALVIDFGSASGAGPQARCRTDMEQNKTVKARFSPWSESFFLSKVLFPPRSCYLCTRQRVQLGTRLKVVIACESASLVPEGDLAASHVPEIYRGTSLMRNRNPLGPYSRPKPRAL